MHKIDLLVFDMAGTVVNEANAVYKTVQRALHKNGFEFSLDFVLEHGAGKEKLQAIKDILQAGGNARYQRVSEKIFEDFKVFLEETYHTLEIAPFEGVESLLTHIWDSSIKIALNTGYNKQIAKLLLRKMNWKKGLHYDVLVTADHVAHGRPRPDMIFRAMEKTGITNPTRVLKAGDSIIDIEEGKNAGCGVTVGVTTGAHSRHQLQSAKPDYVVDSLFELRDILEI